MRIMQRLIVVLLLSILPAIGWANEIICPVDPAPGDLIVLELKMDPKAGKARFSFEAAMMQYVGSVVPTPEIQILSDSLLEITPEPQGSGSFRLKFLTTPAIATATVVLEVGGARRNAVMFFRARVEKKEYHLHILLVAVLLLVLAWGVWRYQKKTPALMSTRSLFMNFEELQKAREEYFPGDGHQKPTPAPAPSPVPQNETITRDAPTPEPPRNRPIAPLPSETGSWASDSAEKMGAARSPGADPAAKADPGANQESLPKSAGSPESLVKSDPRAKSGKDADPTTKVGIGSQPPVSGSPNLERASSSSPPADSERPGSREIGQGAQESIPPSVDGRTLHRAPASGPGKAGTTPSGKTPSLGSRLSDLGYPTEHPPEKKPARAAILFRMIDPEGNLFEGSAEEVSIGRRKESSIILTGAEISRNHVLIKLVSGAPHAVPQSSSNLTELNGKKITQATPIREGDTLSLGGTPFKVEKITF